MVFEGYDLLCAEPLLDPPTPPLTPSHTHTPAISFVILSPELFSCFPIKE
ncbi:hypothetical protein ACRRTK_007239 [Alexandromys fortis]